MMKQAMKSRCATKKPGGEFTPPGSFIVHRINAAVGRSCSPRGPSLLLPAFLKHAIGIAHQIAHARRAIYNKRHPGLRTLLITGKRPGISPGRSLSREKKHRKISFLSACRCACARLFLMSATAADFEHRHRCRVTGAIHDVATIAYLAGKNRMGSRPAIIAGGIIIYGLQPDAHRNPLFVSISTISTSSCPSSRMENASPLLSALSSYIHDAKIMHNRKNVARTLQKNCR